MEDGNWVVVLSATMAEADILIASGRAAEAVRSLDLWYPRLARVGFLRPAGIAVLARGIACNAILLAAFDTTDPKQRRDYIRRAVAEIAKLPVAELEEARAWRLIFEAEIGLLQHPTTDLRPALLEADRVFTAIGLGFARWATTAFLGMLGDPVRHASAADWIVREEIPDPIRFFVLNMGVVTRKLGWKAPLRMDSAGCPLTG